MSATSEIRDLQVVVPNFSRRLSGVTATLERVAPFQAAEVGIATLGPNLSSNLPRLSFGDLLKLWSRPSFGPFRIWHARRNIEMLAGIVLRDVLRFPFRIVFTSASQRHHTRWTRMLINRMNAIISTSAATASYLEHPSTIIPHGIDPSAFSPPADRAAARQILSLPDLRLVGCFGRIRRGKGSDVFVDAMLSVLKTRPGFGAILVGRATSGHVAFLEQLKAEVRRAGLGDRLLILPEVATHEMPHWYRSLDLYVAPQRWEGFGVTPLEAMATGVPVVATKVGAFPDLVTEETGTLVAPGDVDAMAKAIGDILDKSGQLERMSKAARTRAINTFSIENEAKRINRVYRAVWNGESRWVVAD